MWVAPSVGHNDTAIARVMGTSCRSIPKMDATIGSEHHNARSRSQPSIATASTRDMRVTLMGSGRDHSTHIYYVIILIA